MPEPLKYLRPIFAGSDHLISVNAAPAPLPDYHMPAGKLQCYPRHRRPDSDVIITMGNVKEQQAQSPKHCSFSTVGRSDDHGELTAGGKLHYRLNVTLEVL